MEAVRSYEDSLLNHYLIDFSFNDYMRNKLDIGWKRYLLSRAVYISAFYSLIRYVILIFSRSMLVFWVLGDPLYLTGERITLNCCLAFCSLYVAVTFTAFHFCEQRGQNFWYAPMAR